MTKRTLRAVFVLAAIVLATSVGAKPRKVLVLPLDSADLDKTVRTRVNASIQKLSRQIEGTQQTGDVTFGETAAALGCDPMVVKCADEVLTTLGVDEVVWGSAHAKDGQLVITLRRTVRGKPPREVRSTVPLTVMPERAEPGLQPLFGPPENNPPLVPDAGSGSAAVVVDPGSGSATGSGSAAPIGPPVPTQPEYPSHDRNVAIGVTVGGAVAFALGLALWSSYSGLQDKIDRHPTMTENDIRDLRDLEDRANKYAWGGNVMVLAGLAVGGYGTYLIWKDRKARASARLVPVPVEHGTGMTFVLRGRW